MGEQVGRRRRVECSALLRLTVATRLWRVPAARASEVAHLEAYLNLPRGDALSALIGRGGRPF